MFDNVFSCVEQKIGDSMPLWHGSFITGHCTWLRFKSGWPSVTVLSGTILYINIGASQAEFGRVWLQLRAVGLAKEHTHHAPLCFPFVTALYWVLQALLGLGSTIVVLAELNLVVLAVFGSGLGTQVPCQRDSWRPRVGPQGLRQKKTTTLVTTTAAIL